METYESPHRFLGTEFLCIFDFDGRITDRHTNTLRLAIIYVQNINKNSMTLRVFSLSSPTTQTVTQASLLCKNKQRNAVAQ